ncbi:unnamed protein product (macronuclear) [Paramecium tetraurelia]|uniref:Uncharacterized protein n=1 Tax=Paramecium tetraurelia TaxID=5888 RepID=A0E2E8_PARTE|nr:uncharacterized protein GSPATT00022637001 [Paramecium tetraurelia]CAK89465.1 unnamed protein product [Paramecium tetraurelia]|eukprot:XP_001456862.1 hypothetical protein (macronuclear) [Paramecium tetraurelia strain d4-2]
MEIRCTQANHQNLQIIGACIDPECQYQRPYCHYCQISHSQHFVNTIPLEFLSNWMQEKYEAFQVMQYSFQECKSSLQTIIDLFIPLININAENLGLSELSNKIKCFSQIQELEILFQSELKQSMDFIILIADQIRQNMKKVATEKQPINALVQTRNLQNTIQIQTQQYQKKISFELIEQNSIQQTEGCRAIAFNKDDSIVLAACDQLIKVYKHDKGKLNYNQTLNEHKENVVTLNFMMKSDRFVSGSFDSTIIIWQQVQFKWVKQQQLTGHSNCILCLIVNNKEDLIISSSKDCTIKFWGKQYDWILQQTVNEHNKSIHSISLNEQQNQLISCSLDKSLYVMQLRELDQKWIVKQFIEVNQYGYRISFINNNQFVYQPYCSEFMQVYDLDQSTLQYKKTIDIPVKCGSQHDTSYFQLQYLKSKGILINKNGKFINILRKLDDNNQFVVEQLIQFDDHINFGQLSQDGCYLINWDIVKRKLQIRKYKEL